MHPSQILTNGREHIVLKKHARSIDGTNTRSTKQYAFELAYLRPHDAIQQVQAGTIPGTYRIVTAGHAYVAVPLTHTWEREARAVCSYGYTGKLAVYLDATYEAPAFADRVHKREAVHRLNATRVPAQAA
jgi:hypothetical protein